MTEFLFRSDAYAAEAEAMVVSVGPDGVELDRTVFYASSGGQPGDSGTLEDATGASLTVTGTVHPDGDRTRILHQLEPHAARPKLGARMRMRLDWDRRHRLMRMHSALHLLSVVLPWPVTGGQIAQGRSRLDFDIPEPPEDLGGVEWALNAHVAADLPITEEWISDGDLAARPDLVKTMKVAAPRGQGRVRLVRIGAGDATLDLQPCGGTHVRATGEIGQLVLGKIEKKGRQNRRVYLALAS